jgi:glucosamine 6-phosphate synthetase-like amidotransferase/phosphosugar isomerase protein
MSMKLRIKSLVAGLTLLSALALVGVILPPSALVAQAQQESEARKLQGTWRVQVTLRNCQSGQVLRTFPAMLTFAQGGTLTGTTTAFSPAVRSPDHGVWRHTGWHTYSAATEAFLFSPAGVWTTTQRLTQAIEIGGDADEFTSNATVEFLDTSGNVTSTGCATAVGHRFE